MSKLFIRTCSIPSSTYRKNFAKLRKRNPTVVPILEHIIWENFEKKTLLSRTIKTAHAHIFKIINPTFLIVAQYIIPPWQLVTRDNIAGGDTKSILDRRARPLLPSKLPSTDADDGGRRMKNEYNTEDLRSTQIGATGRFW